jgi:deferrochelatase/peroxidase EfeB
MGERPVSAPMREGQPSWRLRSGSDKRAQGLVVSAFTSLPFGCALFLSFEWDGAPKAGGGEWLGALDAVAPITDADEKDPRAAALGLTWSGLEKMGLPKEGLASFDRPFREGMFQEDRLRRLGDRRDGHWLETVVEGGPKWSGNTPPTHPELGEKQVSTPLSVHALLLLYTDKEESSKEWCDVVSKTLVRHHVRVVHRLDLWREESGVAREHFGFADGVSQPLPYENGTVEFRDGQPVKQDSDPWHTVPLGEILMGHRNGNHEIAPGPLVPDRKAGRDAKLEPHADAEGFLDLGLDGSYMVVRELRQYVAQFWQSLESAAEKMRADDPNRRAEWIATRVVGRDLDGNLLCPGGVLPLDAWGGPENQFGFFDRDPRGLGCPMGAHVRRGNPRDGLAPSPADKETLLEASKNHRILRRGRKFGPKIEKRDQDDGIERGLLFIALNTDITRQFEFIQQTWILNPNFATLYDETDPLIGPKGTMTLPQDPLRRIIEVDTFVQVAGGEYFFLPSLPALRYLATL